jgi:hypothetical protein
MEGLAPAQHHRQRPLQIRPRSPEHPVRQPAPTQFLPPVPAVRLRAHCRPLHPLPDSRLHHPLHLSDGLRVHLHRNIRLVPGLDFSHLRRHRDRLPIGLRVRAMGVLAVQA